MEVENMGKMIIGLTCCENKDVDFPCQRTNEDYIHAVMVSQGVPILLPICEDETCLDEQLSCIDGLIVTGGIDINPLFYKEACRHEQGESSTRRDMYEIELIKRCADKKIPILGICRGLQMINVTFGGTLFQDNKLASAYIQQHDQKERKDYPIHSIRVKKDSFLHPIVGEKYYVNSFHHQSIKKVAEGFHVVARSEDSIIEAIQHDELNIWAVQFHPEMMHARDEKMLQIFKDFIQLCQSIKK